MDDIEDESDGSINVDRLQVRLSKHLTELGVLAATLTKLGAPPMLINCLHEAREAIASAKIETSQIYDTQNN